MKLTARTISALICMPFTLHGEPKPPSPKPAPVPVYNPAREPVAKGEVPVGLIVVTFKETAGATDFSRGVESLDRINGVTQEQYFKTYSNGIAWPKVQVMSAAGAPYLAPQFYGYYCEYDYWHNPMGWKNMDEGNQRVKQLKNDAMQYTSKTYRGSKPRFICYNYVIARPEKANKEITADLAKNYEDAHNGISGNNRPRAARNPKSKDRPGVADFDPWSLYAPACRWGDPMWPNSSIQINDFAPNTFAHELGHALGAPDVYHLGRHNDGIGHNASLLAYGPTANAFSRFYHHAYIKEKNHPTLKTSGTYTLHPRDITPQADEAVGYLIPSNHPHYMYHVEYIHNENGSVGVGPGKEGMLISVVNLGLTSYLGSPDYFYVYRPNDPFFRGTGETSNCLFGKVNRRTEFNMSTEPSSRLPNLLDGGVYFKNIRENDGILTFDLVIERKPITGAAYTNSMLPQIRLDEIKDIQSTSFTLECTIKFRGEPVKTSYGFCWSTREHPTVKDATYALAHRECYRGHAINLTPKTTYYVRAFATNGVGVRYSDEEKVVTTLDSAAPRPAGIGPLCTDSFSNNAYLHTEFSYESTATGSTFIGYSPTCVLAKLIAYHRPPKFSISSSDPRAKTSSARPSKSDMTDFNFLNWNPDREDFPMRLEEIRGFFGGIHRQSRALGLHSPKPGKDFIRNLVSLTMIKSKPVLTDFTTANSRETLDLINNDLLQSRPAIILLAYDGLSSPIRWGLIDGVNRKGDLHVDFPRQRADQGDIEPKTGYYAPAALLFPNHKTFIVTNLHYKP